MRLRSWMGIAFAVLCLILAGQRAAQAQGFPFSNFFNPGPSYYYPGQPAPGYETRRPVYREPRRVRRPVYREERQARRPASRREEARQPRRFVRPAPAVEPRKAQPEPPPIEPSTYIVVFGDSLADALGDGLEDAYDEAPEIEIVDKTKGDSGLVRNDAYDWPKVIQDFLSSDPKITFAVMMVGVNDRQPIREGEATHEPLSERWKELYRERVDAVARIFAERKIPLVWVGAPPVRNEKFSGDLNAMNEIYREQVQKAGGVYVDIWPGFVSDENRYAPVGPDVDGQSARLRTGDGIHFTEAGARKAAHFAEVEIKRLIEARAGTNVAAPSPGESPAAVKEMTDGQISASVPSAPTLQAPPKPVAGPVLPLTRPEVSAGGALLTSRPQLGGEGVAADRAFREGVPPGPKPGRADDFKWPRS
jgi:uncharacterized protein